MTSWASFKSDSDITWRVRVALYLLALAGVMFLYGIVYHYTMITYEGSSRPFLHSLQIVVETFTTTGFGSDAPWASPQANLLVIIMDLTGVALIFLALPVLMFPMFEEMVSTTPPTEVEGMSDHVVICSHSSRIETLIDELDRRSIPYVVIEPDRDTAVQLLEDELQVIHGDPTSVGTLDDACLADARALVTDIDDSTDANIVLTAGQLGTDATLITFVRDPSMGDHHRYAGADHVFSPRKLIGESLANKVVNDVSAEVSDAVEIAEDFEIVELPVQAGSDVAGKRLSESEIRERTGVNIIGAWFHGTFESPPPPEATLDDGTLLLAAGCSDQLDSLRELVRSEDRHQQDGHVIIGGHGEVGSTVKARLDAEEIGSVAVDVDETDDGVDVVGDVTNEEILMEAGIEDASTVVLALASDTRTIFAALVIRELNPDIEIIARADETESIPKLYQAGADYVLALATVSGRMLASTILGEDVIAFDQQIEIVRFDVGRLAGQTLANADIRAETGCTILGVERDGEVQTDLDPHFQFAPGDELTVSGPYDSIRDFEARWAP